MDRVRENRGRCWARAAAFACVATVATVGTVGMVGCTGDDVAPIAHNRVVGAQVEPELAMGPLVAARGAEPAPETARRSRPT